MKLVQLVSLALVASTAAAVKSQSSTKCGECVATVSAFGEKFIKPYSFMDFKKWMKFVCDGMKGDQVEHCQDLAAKFGPNVYKILGSEEGSVTICQKIRMCHPGDKTALDYTFGCADCKSVAKIAERMHKKLEKFLMNILCKGMDDYTRPHCTDIIEQFAPVVAYMMKNTNFAGTYCTVVDICPSNSLTLKQEPSMVLRDNAGCSSCMSMVGWMRMGAAYSEEMFANGAVCSQLFFPRLRSACESFLGKYGGMVMDGFKKEMDDTQICGLTLGLCDVEDTQSTNEDRSEEEDYPFLNLDNTEAESAIPIPAAACTTCTTVVDRLRTADISTIDHNLCKQIYFMEDKCEAFVAKYGHSVLDSLQKKLDTDQICTETLKLCAADAEDPSEETKDASSQQLVLMLHATALEQFFSQPTNDLKTQMGSNGCERCLAMTNLARSVVYLVDTVADSQLICRQMPFMGEYCDAVLEKYGQAFRYDVLHNIDDKQICEEELHLCP